MTTAFRRKQALHSINEDARRRLVAQGVSKWHAMDCKHVEPHQWFTGNQLAFAMAAAFLAGFGSCYALIYVLSLEG